IERERAREPRGAHPSLTHRSPSLTLLARCECLKQHGVGEREGELGADFTSIVLPRFRAQQTFTPVSKYGSPADLLLDLTEMEIFLNCKTDHISSHPIQRGYLTGSQHC